MRHCFMLVIRNWQSAIGSCLDYINQVSRCRGARRLCDHGRRFEARVEKMRKRGKRKGQGWEES